MIEFVSYISRQSNAPNFDFFTEDVCDALTTAKQYCPSILFVELPLTS